MLFDFLQKQGASVELAELIVELARAVEDISRSIIATSTQKVGTTNVFGEEQAALDIKAEQIVSSYVGTSEFVAAYCSEELDELKSVNSKGRYSVFYDPLDGSSLIDTNFAVGTIVGIYEGATILGRIPREQVAALYAMYGPRTVLVCSVGNGVHEFILEGAEWNLNQDGFLLDGKSKYFAPGNLRATKEREDYFDLVAWYIKQQYTLRYSGGMVPDIHHILKKGSGVFLYPGMPSAPDGKLRLLYECGPMAYLMEQAGGVSSNGTHSILDLTIESLTQRTPIFVGVAEEVKRVEEAL